MPRMTDDSAYLPPERPPRLAGQQPTARLTLDAYVRLRKELDGLKTKGREEIAERLLRAREHGDIRENADYDQAKTDQGLMEARIRTLEQQLRDPDIVEAGEGDRIDAGMLVTVRLMEDDPDENETYLMAHSSEERAAGARTVTSSSPLGAALLGKRVGERVSYQAPGGTFTYEIVELRPYRA